LVAFGFETFIQPSCHQIDRELQWIRVGLRCGP
jgi:hypothetical protein